MDRLMLGVSTTLVGMLVVFFGLVVLIVCIYVMTSLTGRKARAQQPKEDAAPAPVPETAREIVEYDEPEEDGLAVMAVISAAVAAMLQSEGRESGFVVRRVRRAQSSTARARAARDEQIYSRL